MSYTDSTEHCDAFVRENSDNNVRRPTWNPLKLWIDQKRRSLPDEKGLFHFQHFRMVLETPLSSSQFWSVFENLPTLLSDPNNFDPKFELQQLSGFASTATGNEYRIVYRDPDYMTKLRQACNKLSGMDFEFTERLMDFRVEKAGPWGGETAELVLLPLANHAASGKASVLMIAHPYPHSKRLRVSIDCIELTRIGWLPDLLAGASPHLFEWSQIFNKVFNITRSRKPKNSPFIEQHWQLNSLTNLPSEISQATSMHPSIDELLL